MRFLRFLILILIKLISLLSGLDSARWSIGQKCILAIDVYLTWVGTSLVGKGFRDRGILSQYESYESDELGAYFSVIVLHPWFPCFVLSTVGSVIV